MMSGSPYKTKSILEAPPQGINLDKWQSLCDLLAKHLNVPVVQVQQANDKGIETLCTNSHPNNPYYSGHTLQLSTNAYGHRVVRYNQKLHLSNTDNLIEWQDNPELTANKYNAYLGIPLNWPDGTVFGALAAYDTKAIDQTEDVLQFFEVVKEHIDTELKYVHLLQKYHALSETDEMTNLKNRRGFFKNAEHLCEIGRREKRAISVCYFDLNNLEWVNDTFGRDTGDLYISSFAAALTEITRKSDVIGRLGGDEFALLSLISDSTMTSQIIIRLRESFQSWIEDSTMDVKATFSVGSKTFEPPHMINLEDMIAEADALMYQQKLATREKKHHNA